jgi:hypothetical protein
MNGTGKDQDISAKSVPPAPSISERQEAQAGCPADEWEVRNRCGELV